jgi:hypothetical protein
MEQLVRAIVVHCLRFIKLTDFLPADGQHLLHRRHQSPGSCHRAALCGNFAIQRHYNPPPFPSFLPPSPFPLEFCSAKYLFAFNHVPLL